MSNDNRLTVAEVSALKKVSRQSVYNAVSNKTIIPIEGAKNVCFTPQSIASWSPKIKNREREIRKDLEQAAGIIERRGFPKDLAEALLKERREVI